MCYTFLHALGYNIGSSLLDSESIDYCKDLLGKYKDKIILPVDNIVSSGIDSKETSLVNVDSIPGDKMGLDIGPKTIKLFEDILSKCKMVVWNGTLGYSEVKEYETGTKSILEYLSNSSCDTVICGGDTASAAINFGYKDKFMHISTGGGASLELLEGKILPAIDIIEK